MNNAIALKMKDAISFIIVSCRKIMRILDFKTRSRILSNSIVDV